MAAYPEPLWLHVLFSLALALALLCLANIGWRRNSERVSAPCHEEQTAVAGFKPCSGFLLMSTGFDQVEPSAKWKSWGLHPGMPLLLPCLLLQVIECVLRSDFVD
jgi:hypothetical protein